MWSRPASCRRAVGRHGNHRRFRRPDGLVLLAMGRRRRRPGRSRAGIDGMAAMPTRSIPEAGNRAPHPAVDTSKPNIARVYDYLLGGKDNFAADRNEAQRLLRAYPLLPARAVTWIADKGIRQFLDIGAGLPTARNTHQVAQAVDPACRVAYVDNDPMVVSHARALMSASGVTAFESDLRAPATIISYPGTARVIRPDEPLCLILGMVLHFFEAQAASEIMRTLVRSVTPGSYVVISVGSGDEQTGARLARAYTAAGLHNHAAGQVARFFDGLELAGPGLVDARHWGLPGAARPPATVGWHTLAGVGCKRGEDPAQVGGTGACQQG